MGRIMNGWNTAKTYIIDVESAKTEEAIQQKLIEMGWTPPQNNVDRVEVIDKTGRAYTHYLKPSEKMTISMQDNNKTMKIFIDNK
jgi:hypothetical protein